MDSESKAHQKVVDEAQKAFSSQNPTMAPKAQKFAKKMPEITSDLDQMVEQVQRLKVVDLPKPNVLNKDVDDLRKNSRGRLIQPPKRYKD